MDALREAGRRPLAEARSGRRWSGSSRPSSCCPGCRRARTTPGGGIDVRLSCTPLLARGQIARFGALVREAEQLARDLDDQRRLAQALRLLGGALMSDGQYARAAEYEEEVLGLSTVLGDAEVRIAAAWYSSARYWAPSGDIARGSPGSSPSSMAPMPKWRHRCWAGARQAYAAVVCVAGVVSCGAREVRGGPAIRGPRRRVGAAVLAPPDAGVRRERPRLHRCLPGTVRRGHSRARAGPA